MKKNLLSWAAQVAIAAILGSTLYFKFSDASQTVDLFSEVGMGAFGYKLIGVLELLACVLLLIPQSILWGAILSWGVMSGAILAHLTKVGFEGSDGTLGMMAIAAWLLSSLVIYLRRNQASFIENMFLRHK